MTRERYFRRLQIPENWYWHGPHCDKRLGFGFGDELLMEVCAPYNPTYLRLLNIVQERKHGFQAQKELFRYDDVQDLST